MDTNLKTLTRIDSITLGAADPDAAARFHREAFDLDDRVRTAGTDAATDGFRGFTISLVAPQPGNVTALFDAAVAAGADILKPLAKSLWGFGGVVQAPDGAIWNLATSTKKDSAPVSRSFDHLVLLLGAEDVAAGKRLYVERGLAVGKSFGSYVDFEIPGSPIGLGLYKRRALAKSAGVSPEGTGSHRIRIAGDGGSFTDPDGFEWTDASA
ncbi:glyoxalase [Agromyces sp. GXQ0307]|uniref:glyoxalase n=1 Tax=Agromyces sp. GXQ0307 TaxID=3377835 RepID=UPI00383BD7B9